MVNIAGTEIPVAINISGFLSSSWIYVFLVAIFGFFLLIVVGTLLFFRTYKRRVLVWDPVDWKVIFKSRARVIRLGLGGEEILKTLAGGYYVSAYGRRTNGAYWYVQGPDGYWYNSVMSDWNAKLHTIDINPVDRDVRMFHVAVDKQARAQYEKKNNMERWVFALFLFLLVVIFFVGMYVTWGRIGDATAPLAEANSRSAQTAATNAATANQLSQIAAQLGVKPPTQNETGVGGSGLVPAG